MGRRGGRRYAAVDDGEEGRGATYAAVDDDEVQGGEEVVRTCCEMLRDFGSIRMKVEGVY
jgi:hypothetical protein